MELVTSCATAGEKKVGMGGKSSTFSINDGCEWLGDAHSGLALIVAPGSWVGVRKRLQSTWQPMGVISPPLLGCPLIRSTRRTTLWVAHEFEVEGENGKTKRGSSRRKFAKKLSKKREKSRRYLLQSLHSFPFPYSNFPVPIFYVFPQRRKSRRWKRKWILGYIPKSWEYSPFSIWLYHARRKRIPKR